MTQLSRERLEEIAELARKASYKPCAMHMTNLIAVCDSEVIEEMARSLLAAEAREPVATVFKSGDSAKVIMIGADLADGYTDVFAAPQPVAVPDIDKIKEVYSLFCTPTTGSDNALTAIHKIFHHAKQSVSAHDYCAAALNQTRVKQTSGDEPVSRHYRLPKWIPCSERMPKFYDFDIWVFSPTKGVKDGVSWDGHEFNDDEYQFTIDDATHWMEKVYPAAPQEPTK